MVTHSVGGLRSSNVVSKNLRTSSLWERWEGSFSRACGGRGRESAIVCNKYTYLKGCFHFLKKSPVVKVWKGSKLADHNISHCTVSQMRRPGGGAVGVAGEGRRI